MAPEPSPPRQRRRQAVAGGVEVTVCGSERCRWCAGGGARQRHGERGNGRQWRAGVVAGKRGARHIAAGAQRS